jgi:hypothetical protein
MRRNHLVMLVCVSLAAPSILIIAAVVHQERPLEVAPGEVDGIEPGTLVSMEGVIVEGGIRDLDGSAIVTLVGAGGGSARAFLAFDPMDLGEGDTVRLVGTVQLYKGSVEVLVSSEEDISVLSRELRPRASLADLVGEPWRYASLEPRTCVTVACSPFPAGPEGDRWSVVRASATGPSVAVLIPEGMDAGGWAVGERLELTVRVRHDGGLGLVYLEVLGWTALGGD